MEENKMDNNKKHCQNIDCENCENCQKMQIKIDKYQQALDILMDDSIIVNKKDKKDNKNKKDKQTSNGNLYESVMFEDYEGQTMKKVNSDMTESFLVIENIKNLEELNKEELNAIKKQSDFANYDKASKYFQKGSMIYGLGNTVIGIGKYFVGFF